MGASQQRPDKEITQMTGILQHNSDTSHPELALDSQVKGTVLNKTTLTSDASHKFGGPQATCFKWLHIWGVPMTPPQVW